MKIIETVLATIGAIFLGFVMALIFSLPLAWAVMVLVGMAHGEDGRIPALGFLPVFFLTLALGAIAGDRSVNTDS